MNLNNVKNELNTAYRHFGDYDESIIKQNIDTWMFRLRTESEEKKDIVLDTNELISGIVIDIACREVNCEDVTIDGTEYVKTQNEAVLLVVTDNTCEYVLESYESYEAVMDDTTEYKNYNRKRVSLDELTGKYTTIWT